MNIVDSVIVLGSLAVVVAVGLWASRNQDKTARGYFLASGRLPWWIVGAAFVSTSVSREQIVIQSYPFSRVTPNLDNCHIA